jgi:hypothetical protein
MPLVSCLSQESLARSGDGELVCVVTIYSSSQSMVSQRTAFWSGRTGLASRWLALRTMLWAYSNTKTTGWQVESPGHWLGGRWCLTELP